MPVSTHLPPEVSLVHFQLFPKYRVSICPSLLVYHCLPYGRDGNCALLTIVSWPVTQTEYARPLVSIYRADRMSRFGTLILMTRMVTREIGMSAAQSQPLYESRCSYNPLCGTSPAEGLFGSIRICGQWRWHFQSAFYDGFLFVAKIQIPLLKSYNLQNMNT